MPPDYDSNLIEELIQGQVKRGAGARTDTSYSLPEFVDRQLAYVRVARNPVRVSRNKNPPSDVRPASKSSEKPPNNPDFDASEGYFGVLSACTGFEECFAGL